MSEKGWHVERYPNGHTNGYTNGDANGDALDGYVIPRSIPQEPVSELRKPYIAPKGSKLLNPGTHPLAPPHIHPRG
jgi:peroxygenase